MIAGSIAGSGARSSMAHFTNGNQARALHRFNWEMKDG